MRPRTYRLALAALPLAVALCAGPARADTIKLLDGSSLDGVKVVSESWKEVEYRKGKAPTPQKLDAAKIASIEYSSTPKDFQTALETLAAGESQALAVAAGYFELVADNDDAPKHIRATARARQADGLLESGNPELALTAYDQLLTDYPETRHLARALLGKGKAHLYLRKPDEAAKVLTKLQEEVTAKGLGQQYAIEAEYLKLLGQEDGGKPAELVVAYEALRAKAAGVSKDLAWRCAVRLARSKAAANEEAAALALFEEILDARFETSEDVAADAYNGRGRSHYARGMALLDRSTKADAAGDKSKGQALRLDALEAFSAARLDFLRVVVSYPTVQVQQAEALYWAAQAFLNINDDDAKLEAKKLLYRCSRDYPNSTWGKRAAGQV
ncbi:MAG: tetratricopeptide repeat protein [Planctomycetota bacterium]